MKTSLLRYTFIIFFIGILPQKSIAQTITCVNNSGFTTNSTLYDGMNGLTLYGVTMTVSSNLTLGTMQIKNTNGSANGYFPSASLYMSTSGTRATANPVNGASVAINGDNMTITGFSQNMVVGTSYTFYLVANVGISWGTVPSTIKFYMSFVKGPGYYPDYNLSGTADGSTYTFGDPSNAVSFSANTNGVTTKTTLFNGLNDVVIHGITLTSSLATTVNGAILNYTTNLTNPKSGYFPTLKLYMATTTGVASYSDATLVNGATFDQSGSNITVNTNTNITFSPGYKYTFYLVATCTFTGSLPVSSANINFDKIFSYSPAKTFTNSVSGTAKTYALKYADISVIGYNTAANGITQGAISYSQTGIVLYGFGLTVQGALTVSTLDIASNVNVNPYFASGGKLYRSNTPYFSDATPINSSSTSYPGSYAHITGLSETFTAAAPTTVYYFLVGDFTANNTYTAPATVTFNFTASQNPAAINGSSGNPLNGLVTTNGNPFSVIKTYDWIGGADNKFDNKNNFKTITNNAVGAVPDANIAVRIGVVGYTNAPVISAADGNVGQLIFGTAQSNPILTITGTTRKITINSGGIVLKAGATPTIDGDGTVEILSGSTTSTPSGTTLKLTNSNIKLTNAGSLAFGGNFSNAGTTTNTGTITLNAGTYSFSVLTNSGTLTGGSGNIDINGNITNTGTFTLGSGNINIGSTNFKNNGSGTFNTGTGTVTFDRTNTQNIYNNNTSFTIAFKNVTFSNTGGTTRTKTLTGTGAGFSISSTGTLSVSGKTILDAGGVLTLKSDTSGSATVAQIPTTASITGNVNVERYVSGDEPTATSNDHRGYRMLSSPVHTGTVDSNDVYSLDYLIGSAYLTGTTGTAGGFNNTATANPTIYLYRENIAPSAAFLSGNYRGVNKINAGYTIGVDADGDFNIPVGNGYLFFFRGNYATNQTTNTTALAQPVTLTAKGVLNQGTIKVRDWFNANADTLSYTTATANSSIRGYNLVGNPYASSIDWDAVKTLNTADSTVNISPTIYIYNALTKTYNTYIAGHNGVGTFGSNDNIIPSGQGFFVKAVKANADSASVKAKLTFTESVKVTTQVSKSNLLLSTSVPVSSAPQQYIRLQLKKDEISKDNSIIFFKDNAKPEYVKFEDAVYLKGNSLLNLSTMSADKVSLSINQIAFPKDTQTVIPINVNVTSSGLYQLNFNENKNIPKLFEVWLMDAYKKDSLDIIANQIYNFNASTSDKASYGTDRFSLVIRQNPAYQLKLLDFKAAKVTTGAQLSWTAENESNYTFFTVERSTDNGKTFEVIGSLKSNNNGTYAIIDHSPATGLNIYRLKQDDINAKVTYSKVANLMYADQADNITVDKMKVYPNPVNTTVNVAIVPLANTKSTSYTIKITNGMGMLVKTATSSQTNWQDNVSTLLPGTYFVQVLDNSNKQIVGNSKFVKL